MSDREEDRNKRSDVFDVVGEIGSEVLEAVLDGVGTAAEGCGACAESVGSLIGEMFSSL